MGNFFAIAICFINSRMFNGHLPTTSKVSKQYIENKQHPPPLPPAPSQPLNKTNNHFSKTRKTVQIIFGTTREINVFTIKFGRYKLKI